MEEKDLHPIRKRYSDPYFTKLAILDHCREILLKDEEIKKSDLYPDYTQENKKKMAEAQDKEIMDLVILCECWKETQKELYTRRISRFLEKSGP